MAEHAALVVHHDSQLCKRARLVMAGSPRLQSCRKATAGSIRSARWEGSWHASGAARISAADVVANVTGSYGETPTSCDPRVRFTVRGYRESRDQPEHHGPHAFAEDQPADILRRRPECHPYANLLRA